MKTSPHPAQRLPDGYALIRELTRGSSARTVHARGPSGEVVLRIARDALAAGESDQELRVLAALRGPGLAELEDHGTIDEYTTFVARRYVAGVDLATYALSFSSSGDARAKTLAAIVARLCEPLAQLHDAGFVHADLKPENVIVDAKGSPTLTDFGLSRVLGAAAPERAPSGSLYSVAPEVLLGGPATPRSDVFALGMLLARLLVVKHATPARFYAHFPARDALSALEITAEDLPLWSRDLIVTMLEREPERRPQHAASVGAALCARLGIQSHAFSTRAHLEWPVRLGRGAFIEDATTRLSQQPAPFTCEWWVLPAYEDVERVAEDARLAAGLAGVKTTRVDVTPEALISSLELDRAVCAWNDRSRERCVFRSIATDAAGERVLEHWARTASQAAERGEPAPRALIVCATAAPSSASTAFVVRAVPSASEGDVIAFLERELDEPRAERIAEVAHWIHTETHGAAAVLRARFQALVAAGFVVVGDAKLRLLPGELPRQSARGEKSSALANLSVDARLLAAALAAFDEPIALERAIAVLDLESERATRAAAELFAMDRVRRDAGHVSLRDIEDLRALAIDPARMRALSAAVVADFTSRGADAFSLLPHRWRASVGPERAQVVDECVQFLRRTLEQGAVERALDFAARLARAARAVDQALEPILVGESAVAWVAAGVADRALAAAEELETTESSEIRALAARIRGAAALQRAEYDEALAFLSLAETLDSRSTGTIAIARARILFDARRDDELERLVEATLNGTSASERERGNLTTLLAMSRARRGDVDEARRLLSEVSHAGALASDPLREAAVALNASTLERRRGDSAAALELVSIGAAAYESIGFLPGIAQARVLKGGLFRDQGRLIEAQDALENAALVRQRLADHAGAAAARGMFGLVLADRGYVHAAITELERASIELKGLSRQVDAALLDARVEELRARIGKPASASERARKQARGNALDADPRALLSRARAAWLRRDLESASSLASRALNLARSLHQGVIERECETVVREIESKPRARTLASIEGDERVLALLGGLGETADLRELGESLARVGRDDRAARIYFALAGRAKNATDARRDLAIAEALFRTCAAGLLPGEAEAAKRHLLGMPDPFPLDFTTLATHSTDDEDFSMDILALLEINRRLVAQEALPDLLGAIVDSALHVTGAERGFVVLEEDGEIAIQTALDSRRGDIAAPEVELSHSIVRQALAGAGVLRFSNAVEDPELAKRASVVALDLRSILCAPFDIDGGSRGVVYVDHRLKTGAFDERAERLLGLLADQAALAVRQVRRVAEIKRLNRELEREVVIKESDLRAAHDALRAASIVPPASGLVGESAPMRAVHEWIAKAAPSKLPVLVTGASGTGKELAARALHAQSARAGGPFVAENCAALPATLIEAELFGYKKGAFTGADSDRVGLFERASGGTLFLDEIGELPLELQAKLLRVLETGEVRRLGDSRVQKTDVRLVAATNRDLDQLVRENRFRADLLYRMDALRVSMPTLDERVEDIPRLVDHFLRLEEAKGGVKRRIAPAVSKRLCSRAWPGNVRELSNEVARLCVLSSGDITDAELVRVPRATGETQPVRLGGRTLADLEREAIRAAIADAGGDKTKAAEMLGISRAKVYQRVKEWRDEDPSSATSTS